MVKDYFRTELQLKRMERTISYHDNLLLIGSCFTENIGQRLAERQFKLNINPNGIVYNPVSISNTLKRIINRKLYKEDDLEYFNESWISFEHHGSFSHPDKELCLNKMNERLNESSAFFEDPGFLIISLGTAWVYELKRKAEIVANCHKIPQGEFNKRLLEVDEIVASFNWLAEKLKNTKPDCRILLTVSPVRHIRDGLENDSLSKSVLRLAVHRLAAKFPNVHYFPAFELLNSDLRDYRFYQKDLVHPNEMAIDYVWEKFREACISDAGSALMKELEKLHSAVSHKPINPQSVAHKKFIEKHLSLIESLEAKYNFLNLDSFRRQLVNHN